MFVLVLTISVIATLTGLLVLLTWGVWLKVDYPGTSLGRLLYPHRTLQLILLFFLVVIAAYYTDGIMTSSEPFGNSSYAVSPFIVSINSYPFSNTRESLIHSNGFLLLTK
jgi:ribose/xylose/arabinose/galactoside ABC-type transport system permease subunit